MSYDKLLVGSNGEEFPYSESFDEDTYHYLISIVWDDRDGELSVLNNGSHIEFDDDGSWLDFNFSPKSIFPGKAKLTNEEMLQLLVALSENEGNAATYSKEAIDKKYKNYLESKKL
jgi:hypothetical protein